MFQKIVHDLATDLETDDTLALTGDFDEFRIATAGHIWLNKTQNTRYAAPDDFTIASDDDGHFTVTWLHADTQAEDDHIVLGVAYIDSIIGGSVSSTAASGGATEVTLDAILVELQTPPTFLPLPALQDVGDDYLPPILVSESTADTFELVAAVALETITVHKLVVKVAGATTLTFKSDGVAVFFPLRFSGEGAFTLDFSSFGWFRGTLAENLEITSSAAVQIDGAVYATQGAAA